MDIDESAEDNVETPPKAKRVRKRYVVPNQREKNTINFIFEFKPQLDSKEISQVAQKLSLPSSSIMHEYRNIRYNRKKRKSQNIKLDKRRSLKFLKSLY